MALPSSYRSLGAQPGCRGCGSQGWGIAALDSPVYKILSARRSVSGEQYPPLNLYV